MQVCTPLTGTPSPNGHLQRRESRMINRFRFTAGVLALAATALVGYALRVSGQQPAIAHRAECRRATGIIKLDGRLDEADWGRAQVIGTFMVPGRNRPSKTKTSVKFLWDDKYLYFGAEMEDHDIYADVKMRNGMTWDNDVIELFLKPSEQK